MTRTDGTSLLIAKKSHVLFGLRTGGKSWIALWVLAQVVMSGGLVVWLDAEDDEDSFYLRWVDAGQNPEMLRGMRLVCNEMPSEAEWAAIVAGADLVVIDSVNATCADLGLDPSSGRDMGVWRKRLVTPALRAGATTIQLDHTARPSADRPKPADAFGSVTKLDGITGTALMVASVKPFSMETAGRSTLTVVKDRPGATGINGEVVAEAHFTPTGTGALMVKLTPVGGASADREADLPGTGTMAGPAPAVATLSVEEAVMVWADTRTEAWSKNLAAQGVRRNKAEVLDAIDRLVKSGQLVADDSGYHPRFDVACPREIDAPISTVAVIANPSDGTPNPIGAPIVESAPATPHGTDEPTSPVPGF